MVHKDILTVPYDGDLNAFAFPLGGHTYLSDEEEVVSIFFSIPGTHYDEMDSFPSK